MFFRNGFFVFACNAETEQGVAQAIIRSVIDFKRDPWPRVSDNAKDLVRGMLNPDPKRRLTAQQVLGNNQFVTPIDSLVFVSFCMHVPWFCPIPEHRVLDL